MILKFKTMFHGMISMIMKNRQTKKQSLLLLHSFMIMEVQFSVWTSLRVFMYAAKNYTTVWFLRTQSNTVNSNF
jgi:hypothetical protein